MNTCKLVQATRYEYTEPAAGTLIIAQETLPVAVIMLVGSDIANRDAVLALDKEDNTFCFSWSRMYVPPMPCATTGVTFVCTGVIICDEERALWTVGRAVFVINVMNPSTCMSMSMRKPVRKAGQGTAITWFT